MKQPLRRANVRWFSEKQKAKHKAPRRTPMQLVALRLHDLARIRLHDLARIFRHRYGVVLPDDDAGRDDLVVAVNHLASLARPRRHIANWLELWAPWLTVREQRDIVGAALANPQHWKADALAWRLRLTKEERRMLGITTIGAIDENKAARAKRRRQNERERKARIRRAAGAKPRQQYEEQSTAAAMPWITEGISRRTWYRRRAQLGTDGTRPVTA